MKQRRKLATRCHVCQRTGSEETLMIGRRRVRVHVSCKGQFNAFVKEKLDTLRAAGLRPTVAGIVGAELEVEEEIRAAQQAKVKDFWSLPPEERADLVDRFGV